MGAAVKVSTTEARDILPELVSRAECGETVEFTKYGKVKAVLISEERYERLTRELFSD
ncbi:type II toxin-antitoxin system prevent-host-death family antitoxin [Streptomyces sp. S1D4-14]|nr:type II toxin-antitoxin system prevent-host-death family antitoxin [Streptomyces sp. S1D4-20]QDN73622.1 type II toxin-antitoxin system prevent-host-death family antitoxin [Streptomyces sp. S1D4-14]QDO56211.1 type II toxin-antitoxin system prevent-host-death family antitoxin [Streptomyces sp. RLB3-5]QDO66110.1 type II toxin-antitoxin system prevent-host-death family antitoxin [Streptomyces sp. RLB1-8]